jgi:hypothetical protein
VPPERWPSLLGDPSTSVMTEVPNPRPACDEPLSPVLLVHRLDRHHDTDAVRVRAEVDGRQVPVRLRPRVRNLHGNNVYPYNGAAEIVDWGDACVSHPFLTPEWKFEHQAESSIFAGDSRRASRLRVGNG